MKRRLVKVLVFVGVFAVAAGVTACAGSDGTAPGARTDRPAGSAATDRRALDTYLPADVAFFARFQLPGAILARPPATLQDAATASTAVIVAEVADVKLTRTIGGIQHLGIVLRTVETLRGQLRPELAGEVVVEMAAADTDPAAMVADFRRSLPAGRSVWFLRWQGEPPPTTKTDRPASTVADKGLYNLISMQGVFVQGEHKVRSAVTEDSDAGAAQGTMQADGERFAQLSALVDHVRTGR